MCQNEQFSITGDPSFVVRELLSLKSSTKFLWPFSLVNPVMLPEMFSNVTFQKTGEKIFETEISAHMGCALGTPNFLDLVDISPTTSSLNRIFLTFFLEKKSGGGEETAVSPQSRKTRIFKVLSWAGNQFVTFPVLPSAHDFPFWTRENFDFIR